MKVAEQLRTQVPPLLVNPETQVVQDEELLLEHWRQLVTDVKQPDETQPPLTRLNPARQLVQVEAEEQDLHWVSTWLQS